MEPPNIRTEIYDPKAQVRWIVVAFRKLSDDEAVSVIRTYLSNAKKKDRPKRGEEITIVTVIAEGDNFFA